MSIRYLLIVVISLGSIVTDSAFAVDQQGLDQFKESIIETIYTDPEFLPLIDVEQAQIELSDLSKSFEQLQGEYSRIDEYKGELEEKYGDIQVTIEYIISDTDRTKQALAESLTQISVLGRKIASLKDALELLQQDLEESISYAETYARFLYKIGNDYFGSDLEISDLKLLVRSENIAQTLSSDDLVQLLMIRLNELLTTIEEKQRLYLTYTLQLNKARVTYQRGVEYYSEELVRLQEQESHLYELMSYLQEDLARAQQKVQEIEASRQQLDKQISTIQQATSQRQLVNEGSPVYKLLNKDDRDDGDRYFTWPVLPFDEVEYYYQDPYYLQEKGSPMQGVYINLPQ
jgi:peptidoglycan hydrolase CwlO-like protein